MTTPLDQTRAAFEAWHAEEHYDIAGLFDEVLQSYRGLSLSQRWVCWQAAIASRAVPEGWQLVPIKPTDEMMGAVVSSMDEHLMGKDGAEAQYREDWAAMLAAAPQAPVADQPAEPSPADDEALEEMFKRCGGKWSSDGQWVIEDADFHPFMRTILAAPKGDSNG